MEPGPSTVRARCPNPWIIREFPITVLLALFTSHIQFSSVQSLTHVQLFMTPWTAARQASLSIINSRSLLKLMSTESVMPSNHLILCNPLLLLPSVFPSIRVFSKGWFSFSCDQYYGGNAWRVNKGPNLVWVGALGHLPEDVTFKLGPEGEFDFHSVK